MQVSLCVNLLYLSNGILKNNDGVAVEDIVYIECVHKRNVGALNVAGALLKNIVLFGENDKSLFACLYGREDISHLFCFDSVH